MQGLATAPVIEYLTRLGVTSIELMPVHSFLDDRQLIERGLRNYWGYNSIGFFALEPRYLATNSIYEFKTMVKTLHSAGLEVILDVVYNHTVEGNHLGPTLSLKGIDNSSYYRLVADNPRYYKDYTGTGNTLNMQHPRVLQLIMDSLRYWVLEMHVDGFRFDLAATLARELHEVDRLGAFLDIIHQDPVLSQVKLIAEPWDLGEGGYQVGNFPVGWAEWNDRYRDTVRAYWKGGEGLLGDLAYRITGSSDLYAHSGRRPYASINFVTSHDGFTLQDLVSYNEKHNEANGEDNRDGNNNNLSWNCGVEGPTDDSNIQALRAKQKRNLLAMLLLSQGVPMMYAGDAIGHTQTGKQQRLLPGQCDQLAELEFAASRSRLAGVRAANDQPAQEASRIPPSAFFPGPPDQRGQCKRCACGSILAAMRSARTSGAILRYTAWECFSPGREWMRPMNAAGNSATTTSSCFSTLTTKMWDSLCRHSVPVLAGAHGWTLHEKVVCAPSKRMTPAHAYPLQARSMVVLMERRGIGKKEEPNEAPL